METKLSDLPRIKVRLSCMIDEFPFRKGGYLNTFKGKRLLEVLEQINHLMGITSAEKVQIESLCEKARKLIQELPLSERGSVWGHLSETFVKDFKSLQRESEPIFEDLISVHKQPPRDEDLIDPWSVFSKEQQLSIHFSHAIQSEDTVILTRLITSEDVNPSNQGISGTTYLCEAIEKNSIIVLSLLLENNADPNGVSSDATTPLFLAVINNRIDMIKVLLKYNVELTDDNLAQHFKDYTDTALCDTNIFFKNYKDCDYCYIKKNLIRMITNS